MPVRTQDPVLRKRVRFDLETVVRKIMLRRLLSRRSKAEKFEPTATAVEENTANTIVNNENNNSIVNNNNNENTSSVVVNNNKSVSNESNAASDITNIANNSSSDDVNNNNTIVDNENNSNSIVINNENDAPVNNNSSSSDGENINKIIVISSSCVNNKNDAPVNNSSDGGNNNNQDEKSDEDKGHKKKEALDVKTTGRDVICVDYENEKADDQTEKLLQQTSDYFSDVITEYDVISDVTTKLSMGDKESLDGLMTSQETKLGKEVTGKQFKHSSADNQSTECEHNSAVESRDQSDAESDEFSPQDSARSDQDEKDSGIEKGGESPTPPQTTHQAGIAKGIISELDLPSKTLQLLSPVSLKPRRVIRRTKSERRPKGMDTVEVDSELSGADDSSPEKSPHGRRNMTVSYLNFPQRYVRSSLAVEARLSQWHRETIQGRGADARLSHSQGRGEVAAPASTRKGILKQTEESTARNGSNRRQQHVRGQRKALWDSSDSGLSDDESHQSMRIPVRKIYSNKTVLRRRIDDLEGMLATMTRQKRDLDHVIDILRSWSAELREVKRTKLGVPYIRSVKQVFKKQTKSLCNKKGEFNQLVTSLQAAQIPCIDDVTKIIQQLRKEVSSIVEDKRRYSVQSVEHVRFLQGRVTGTCTAIKDVYYETD